jgi:hypothetical protein
MTQPSLPFPETGELALEVERNPRRKVVNERIVKSLRAFRMGLKAQIEKERNQKK